MSDEGTQLEMTEYILMEKELRAKIEALEARLVEPEARLDKAKALLLKAKAAFEGILEEVRPLRSDKILLEGELESVLEKKAQLRIEARVAEGGGIRPGTSQLVEQMNEIAGDPEEARIKREAQALDVDAALAALKADMGE